MFSNQSQLLSYLKDSLKTTHSKQFRLLLVLAGDAASQLDPVLDTFSNCLNGNLDQNLARTPAPNSRATEEAYRQDSASDQTVTTLTNTIMHVPELHGNSDVSDQINNLLGTENSCIVFDANGVFDPRQLAASAGTIIAGGVIIVITPPLQHWDFCENCVADSRSNQHSAFLERFKRKLIAHQTHVVSATATSESIDLDTMNHVALFIGASAIRTKSAAVQQTHSRYTQLRSTCVPRHAPNPTNDSPANWKIEQNAMVEQLLSRLRSPVSMPVSPNVVVVQGDRGRGKSALIGRAIKQLNSLSLDHGQTIALCSTRRSSCGVLLAHAQQTIDFFTIQQALNSKHEILIVEEAGSIPIAILEKLLLLTQTIIFATTVEGYEGAGRGFALRFAKRLDTLAPNWLLLKPELPVRWSLGDPVEAFINDAFLLGQRVSTLPQQPLSVQNATVDFVDKNTLLNNDQWLEDIFGLLVQAHYQTTPADLRNILDKDSLQVYAQRCDGVLTGAALVALEGDIPDELHRPIIEKKRRLKDQILPQLLAQSAGQTNGLAASYARIVRIAVHPAIQQQGFGTHLFSQINRQLASQIDVIGASFGADTLTLAFWLKQGLSPVHYGYKANPRSGLRSACLMSTTNQKLSTLIKRAEQILRANTLAFVEHGQDTDPVARALTNGFSEHNFNLCQNSSSADTLCQITIDSLVDAFAEDKRNFIDTAGLLLRYSALQANSDYRASVSNALKVYPQLTPAKRRKLEAHLRLLLRRC